MSLGPWIRREPGDELPVAERLIYNTFLIALLDNGTTPERAILKAAKRCGVPRRRVLEVIRAVNAALEPDQEGYDV